MLLAGARSFFYTSAELIHMLFGEQKRQGTRVLIYDNLFSRTFLNKLSKDRCISFNFTIRKSKRNEENEELSIFYFYFSLSHYPNYFTGEFYILKKIPIQCSVFWHWTTIKHARIINLCLQNTELLLSNLMCVLCYS